MNPNIPPPEQHFTETNIEQVQQHILLALEAVFSPQSTTSTTSNTTTANNNNNNPEIQKSREEADRYLTSFQKSKIAWRLCNQLLSFSLDNKNATSDNSSASNSNGHNNNNIPSTNNNDNTQQKVFLQQVHFFAAQTLHTKCQTDIWQLRPIEQLQQQQQQSNYELDQLRDSLMNHLSRFCSTSSNANTSTTTTTSTYNNPVITRLAMALCSLAIQMNWITILQDMLQNTSPPPLPSSTLSSNNNYDGMTQNCMEYIRKIHVLLELTQYLPEECNSQRLLLQDERQRLTYRTVLRESSAKIFEFLSSLYSYLEQFQQQQQQQQQLQVHSQQYKYEIEKIYEKIWTSLLSWIRHVDIPPTLLQSSPLIDLVFVTLHPNIITTMSPTTVANLSSIISSNIRSSTSNMDDSLFEIIIDVIIELLRSYPSDDPSNMGLITKVIPYIMALAYTPCSSSTITNDIHNGNKLNLSPFQKALQEEDEDGLRAYCRVFTEMGESCMSLIMSHEDLNQIALVDLVLACSAIADYEIANITLHFWFRFVSWLEELEPYDYRQIQIDYFSKQLMQLTSTCTSLMKYPTDVTSLPNDKLDDLHKDRMYVSDTLQDCCRLLGGHSVLTNIGKRMEEECTRITSNDQFLLEWHGLEACFFALKSTARYVSSDEMDVLPSAFELIFKLPSSNIVHLRNTIHDMIGLYALWLNHHPDKLEHILPYLAQGLTIRDCASSAALAIKELCEHCSTTLSLGDSALQLYDGIVASQQQQQEPILGIKDELQILEGACKAISLQLEERVKSNPNQDPSIVEATISTYVGRIVQPIGEKLMIVSSPNYMSNPRKVAEEIERLTVVVRFLNVPNDRGDNSSRSKFLLEVMTQCWPLLESISAKYPHDIVVAEKVCRLHKYVLRLCGASSYMPMLDRLCSDLVTNYARSHLSPYLYAASICVVEYGRDPALSQILYSLLSEMCRITFGFLRVLDDFTSHPDIVEELFFLASRMISYCPQPLISSSLLTSLIQCASIGMKVYHKDANRGTLNFIENILSYGIKLQNERDNAMTTPPGGDNLQQVIMTEGQNIVMNLVLSLLGQLPCYRIRSVAENMYKLKQLCPGLLNEWLNSSLQLVPEPSKSIFMQDITQTYCRDDFYVSVERFAAECERLRKMGVY